MRITDSSPRIVIEQLRKEWSNDDASPEKFNEPLCAGPADHDEVCPKQSLEATENIEGGDVDNIRGVLKHAKVPRPITPNGFVREAAKHTPAAPNFREAMRSKDKADLESQYPFGHRLMTKQGWSGQNGLGPDGSGIQRPIDADILARHFTESESPAGLGCETDTNGKSPAHKTHRQNITAWHQYAADPHKGDKTAQAICRNHDTADGAEKLKVAHPAAASTSANSKTIIQNGFIIRDNWKFTPPNSREHPNPQKCHSYSR